MCQSQPSQLSSSPGRRPVYDVIANKIKLGYLVKLRQAYLSQSQENDGRMAVLRTNVARHPGSSHGDLIEAMRQASGDASSQIGGYLQTLSDRYRLIESKLPIFAKPTARRSRYYLSDNFLESWLAAIAPSVAAREFRPQSQ